MKKNAMLKIAAVLLVAVLLTTCAISSTFAKYATASTTYEDSARVAKWGLVVDSATAFDSGFEKNYNDKVNADVNVVAPGTMGTINFKYVISGDAEVDAKVIFTDGTTDDDIYNTKYITVDDGLDDKIVFFIGNGGEVKTLAQVNEAISKLEAKYEAGATATQANELNITWMWKFDNGNDSTDTTLGNAYSAKINVKIVAQIVQDGPAIPAAA